MNLLTALLRSASMSKELYVYTDPQLPSGLMEPAVAVGTATGFEVVVSDQSGMIIVQFPLWHLFTPQNVSSVPHLSATEQHEPICHHILGLCFAYRSCHPCYIPRENPDKHLSSMFLGDMSLCVTISRTIVGRMVKRMLYLLPHSPVSALQHVRSSLMHEAFPLLGPHSPLGERIG
jgi:hypothetical protein